MTRSAILLGLLVGATPSIALAQQVVELNISDIMFQWQPRPKGSALCGYAVFGNHFTRKDPKTEWDLNIDEVVQGDVRVAAVTAGTFEVHGTIRSPRSPITALSFTTEDDPEPLSVELVGEPNQDNGVRGTLEIERATKLFHAFSNEHKIEVTLKYADGTSDLLKFRGFRDAREFGRGKNSPFDECLRGRLPMTSKFGMHPVPQ